MSGRTRYLLDTNVLSETRRRLPDPRVMSFLSAIESSDLFVSVLTLGELRKGVELKRRSDPEVAKSLGAWVEGIEFMYADRIVGIDATTAKLWGEWSAERPRPVVDTLLAATSVVHGFTLVTRNTTDVVDIRVRLLNPWR